MGRFGLAGLLNIKVKIVQVWQGILHFFLCVIVQTVIAVDFIRRIRPSKAHTTAQYIQQNFAGAIWATIPCYAVPLYQAKHTHLHTTYNRILQEPSKQQFPATLSLYNWSIMPPYHVPVTNMHLISRYSSLTSCVREAANAVAPWALILLLLQQGKENYWVCFLQDLLPIWATIPCYAVPL